MAIKLAANLSLLFDVDTAWPDRCRRAAEQGFRHAEILFPYDEPASQYRKWINDAGLSVVLINTPVDGHPGLAAVVGEENRYKQDIERAIDVAGELGAGAIHVMAGRSGPGVELDMRTLLANLEYAVRKVENTPIVLMLEALNHHDMPGYFYQRPEQVLAVLRQLPSPHLRQQFDFYHTLREELDLLDELARCRPYIGHVQIARPPSRCEPDLHEFDMLNALERLDETGYTGWIGCEYRPAASFEAGLGWLAPLKSGRMDQWQSGTS